MNWTDSLSNNTQDAEKLRLLRSRFLVHLSEKLKSLSVILHCDHLDRLPAPSLQTIQTVAHQLSGNAGVYGFASISEAAKKLDQYLKDNETYAVATVFDHIKNVLSVSESEVAAALKNAPTPLLSEENNAEASPSGKQLPVIAAIDDDPMILLAYQISFEGKALLIMGKNANDARAIMLEHSPDLVILDDIMPGGQTGLSFMESINNDPSLSRTPVIMVTASNAKENVLRGLSAGAVDYVVKPFMPETLVNLALKVLSRKKNHIVLSLSKSGLIRQLDDKLASLECLVDIVNDQTLATSIHQSDNSICVFDLPHLEVINKLPRFSSYIFIGSEAPPPTCDLPILELHDESADSIIKHIGRIIAQQKNQAATKAASHS